MKTKQNRIFSKGLISSRTTILLLLVVLVLSVLSSQSVFAIDDSPNLQAKLLSYSPIPVQPGQYVTAYIQIDNLGSGDAPNAAIKINDEFPFSLTNKADSEKIIGTINGGGSYVTDYRFKIDGQALVGTNKLNVYYTDDYSKGGWKKTALSFTVKNTNGVLSVERISSIPSEIKPGDKGVVTLVLKNNGETTLWIIATKLNLETTTGDLPFIPTSTTEQRISSLSPNETMSVSIPLKAYPSADPGYFKVPLEIEYVDDEGLLNTRDDFIGLIIKAEPELKVYVKDVSSDDGVVNLQLQFVNKGISDLKFLDINVIPDSKTTVTSSSNRYIGDLDSDDYRSETFTLKTSEKEFPLKINASFKDQNNNVYDVVLESSITIPDEKRSYFGFVILVLSILIIVFFFWRYSKGGSKIKSKLNSKK